MPGGEEAPAEYSYRYHADAKPKDTRSDAQVAEDMRYIEQTILNLTGGCEICQHSSGPFCTKHQRPIKPGDTRCEFFARRFSEDPEKSSRDKVEYYIGDRLGIKDRRSVRRLMGDV